MIGIEAGAGFNDIGTEFCIGPGRVQHHFAGARHSVQ